MKNHKKIILLYFALLFLFAQWTSPFQQREKIRSIEEAIRSGQARKLAPLLHAFVDITMDKETKTCNRNQAEILFQNFFQKYPVSNFTIVHIGAVKKGLQYVIGQYTSEQGNYSTLIKTRTIKGRYLIYEISFIPG